MEFLEPWLPHLAALGGLLVGIVATCFFWHGKLNLLRARYGERAKSAERSIVDLEAAAANLEAEVRQLRHTEAVSLKRQAELEVLAKHQAKAVDEKQQLLHEAEQRLANQFELLSSQALKSTQDEFLRLARATFDSQQKEATSELEQRRIAVETLVRPVAATLSQVEHRIGDLEQARRESEATLSEQVRQMAAAQMGLQKETSELARALRQPVGRGRWGEIQLKRVVELTGMRNYCDISDPGAGKDDDEARPDLLVNLPTGRQIAVDARAPLDAGLAALEATDDEARAAAVKEHAAKIAAHLEQLASPAYRGQFKKRPEFVVLFLPSESFLSAALSEDASLMERGIERGVILATPTTLVALLRAAAVGWRQEGIAEKARTVSAAGRELFAQVSTLAEHVARVGQSLDATVQNFNGAIGALEGEVLPSARRLGELGVAPDARELPAAALVDRSVRPSHRDLTNLPLKGDMNSMAATGEVPDDSFEGFAAPTTLPAESPRPAKKKAVPAARNKPSGKDSKAGRPDSEAAAGDLRAALEPQKKAG